MGVPLWENEGLCLGRVDLLFARCELKALYGQPSFELIRSYVT